MRVRGHATSELEQKVSSIDASWVAATSFQSQGTVLPPLEKCEWVETGARARCDRLEVVDRAWRRRLRSCGSSRLNGFVPSAQVLLQE